MFCLSSSNFLIFSSNSCFILSIKASFSLCKFEIEAKFYSISNIKLVMCVKCWHTSSQPQLTLLCSQVQWNVASKKVKKRDHATGPKLQPMKDARQLHRFPYRWNEAIISVLKVLSFLLGQNLSSPHSVVWQPVHLHHICSSHFLTEVNIGNNSVNSELWTAFFLSKQQKSGTIN